MIGDRHKVKKSAADVEYKTICGVEVEFPVRHRKGKIDPEAAAIMLDEGYTKEIAEAFGVALGTVYKHFANKRRKSTELIVGNTKEATQLVRRELNALDQLHNINDKVNVLLERATEGLDILEDAGEEDIEDIEGAVELTTLIHSAKDTVFRAMSEIRGQIELQLKMYKELYSAQAAQEFQEELLAQIAEEEPSVRDRIVARLRKRRSVRQAVSTG